jgi:electron transfer flavoprotein alpha subunit
MDLDFLQSLMGGEEMAAAETAYQDIWVVGEVSGEGLTPATRALLGKARDMANALGVYVKGVLFSAPESAGSEMISYGADTVYLLEGAGLESFAVEPYAEALARQIESGRPEIVLFNATSLGGELAPRLAARFRAPLFTHCMDLSIDEAQRALLATVPRLGGEYYEILISPSLRPQFATVEPGVLPAPFADPYRFGSVERVTFDDLPAGRVEMLGPYAGGLPEPPLSRSRVIVCVGRGVQDTEGVELARRLAAKLGGQLAGTRGALDEGWISEEQLVGMAGRTVRPALYIACGVAGAIQHMLGIAKTECLIAINTDPKAEIFPYADLGVVADAKAVLEELNKKLDNTPA